jgi:hypothetical protein
MRLAEDIFIKTSNLLQKAEGGTTGPWSPGTAKWFQKHDFPKPLQQLFQNHIPKSEIWAGAGTLFGEIDILKWNDHFPEALHNNLLIVGTAANGDHIAIDLVDGGTGYISHEQKWRSKPRDFFIPVSVSLGNYLRAINQEKPKIPEDYWQAKKR